MCSAYLSEHLSNLFNLCLSNQKFPLDFKVSKINPIFKKGSKTEIANHRPISVLTNLSKIFENLIFSRTKCVIDSLSVLSENQFGFRKQKNTELAAMTLINRALPALKEKSFALCVFLDFSACFDTICRNTALHKLLRYGFHPDSVGFLWSYFSERKQYVFYNGKSSDTHIQNLGVIQGSKNGPLFFDIYSNDINYLCTPDENILFADDTCLVYVGDDLRRLETHVNNRLATILDWCRFNKLSINPTISEVIIVPNKKLEFEPKIMLGEDVILRKNSVKYLGMLIDDKLKFSDHVTHLNSKLAVYSGVSYRLQNRFNLRTAKNYYYSCVFSVLSYCISAWGGVLLNSSRGADIIKRQKKIIKNLFSKHYAGSRCLFKASKILKVIDIYKLYCSIHMFKIVNENSNPYLQNSIEISYPSHRYNTRNRNQLLTPFPRVDAIRYNFQYQFIDIWNQVPDSIKESGSLRAFKRRYFEHILNTY